MTVKEVQQAYDTARDLFARRNFSAADAQLAYISEVEPDHAGAMLLRGVIALENNNPRTAACHLEAATRLDPNNASCFAQLAKACVLIHDNEGVRRAAARAMELNPRDALVYDTIGVALSHVGEHTAAAEAFIEAVSRQPRNAGFLYNLGTSLRFAGDFHAAEHALDRALAVDPELYKAHYALAYLRKQTPQRNHIPQLQKALARLDGSTAERMQLGYALHKEYDDTGEYAKAWNILSEVNTEWNTRSGYSPETDLGRVEKLVEVFDPQRIAADVPGYDSAEPIFIFGLPRSGTTLTERILSSHSQVQSAGELPNFSLLVKQMTGTVSHDTLDRRTIRKMAHINLADLGRRYIDSTRPLTGKQAHFVDKMPFNFLYAGLIMLALPNAKIICLRRNMMDVCFANYRQLFTLGHPFYAYSYDLQNIGRYYLLFEQLMHHWERLFPGRIFELQYERLLDEQEPVTRRLLDHCGLQWEDACLEFEKNAAPVATASSAQVREPINRAGYQRWRNYEMQLQPLMEFFRNNGVDVR
jgi:Tfp pilus assembly protein PilF